MGVLQFETTNLITGVNVIDGNLYWTDNNSEPKKLEIDIFRGYDHTGESTAIRGDYVIESDLSVIRLHPWQPISLNLTAYTATATQPEPPFEQIFPRFSYRWRYEDGQYSPYAPFTQAAFMPGNRTEGTTNTENYTEGFNTTMFNNVGQIDLNNIPRGPRDVVAVDLLYTESISSTVYVLETIDIPPSQRGMDYVLSSSYVSGEPRVPQDYALLPLTYSVSARKIYSALPANQLTRPYDEVPQRAKAQEITANRLIYGNYQIGFDQPDPLRITTEFVNVGTDDGLHVKGNRAYEIGVAYIDAYGRQGSMVQAGSVIQDDGSVLEAVPLTSAFNQTQRQQIRATITSNPPPWADRYRYFIKDPAMDHHNLISYNIYNDGGANDTNSEFVWIEFQSTDRNKVQAEDQTGQGTVLVRRRTNDTVATTKERFLVQDIQNEAPDDVRRQITQTATNTSVTAIGNIPASRWRDVDAESTTSMTTIRDQADGVSWQTTLNVFNNYLRQNEFTGLFEENPATNVTHNLLTGGVDPAPLYIKFSGSPNVYVQVIELAQVDPDSGTAHGLQITYGGRFNINEESGQVEQIEGVTGLPSPSGGDENIELFTSSVSEEALERLGGRFWVRTARNNLTTLRSSFTFDGELESLQQIWFETEPIVADSQLDLFWESSDTFCVKTEHGYANDINWYNCVAEVQGGVYLESTRINDKFNSVQLVKGVRVNTPTDRNAVIQRPYGLTWSGIYNSTTGINRLNEFITADGIVKELEPNYGSLQKLHTRDTNIIAFCEDKVFRILADKDLLFNADGGGNVSAANVVLGQTTPFVGEYGIGTNPESFASYGHNVWFSDAKRGTMCQLTPGNGQIFEISQNGMDDFFRDRLFSATNIIGMYDDYTDSYVVSVQGYDHTDAIIDPNDQLPGETSNVTLKYETSVEGWPSFLSYIPEAGLTLNNRFYTFKNGQLYMHNSNTAVRNNFYGEQYNSDIQVIFNDNASAVKEWLTVGYEGTDGWELLTVDTEDSEEINTQSVDFPFVKKEGKYFKPLVFTEPIYEFQNGEIVDSGRTREKSGIKGFYNNVTLRNTSTESAELFAINSENYISSN